MSNQHEASERQLKIFNISRSRPLFKKVVPLEASSAIREVRKSTRRNIQTKILYKKRYFHENIDQN